MSQEYRFDFNNLSKSPWVSEITKYLAEYEKKAKKLIQGLDVRSPVVREKGLENLEKLSSQVSKKRKDFEKKVKGLVHKESKRFNEGINEFLEYVRTIAKADRKVVRRTRSKKSAVPTQKRQRKQKAASSIADLSTQTTQPTA